MPFDNIGFDPQRSTYLGDLRFRDVNGDNVIDGNDEVNIGDPIPDFNYSFNLKASYKNFDFSAFFTGVQGVDVLNFTALRSKSFVAVSSFSTDVLNRYTATNTNTNIERYTATDPNNNVGISDKYIEDGSYLRFKNVTLGYSLNRGVLDNLFDGSINKLRVYVQGQNLYTFTKYTGVDPDVRPVYSNQGTINGLGIDRGFSPAALTFITGLQIEF